MMCPHSLKAVLLGQSQITPVNRQGLKRPSATSIATSAFGKSKLKKAIFLLSWQNVI